MNTQKPRLHKVGEPISTAQHQAWARYWAQWDYTVPVCDALSVEFGVGFGATNTGGGCICIQHETPLEGGYSVSIGSGVDGPLWTNEDRATYHAKHGRHDGYGVEILHADHGYVLAAVVDQLAQTPHDVVAMVHRALDMARTNPAASWQYVAWQRDADGAITEQRYHA